MHRGIIILFAGVSVACAGGSTGEPRALEAGELITAFQDGVAPAASYRGTRDTMLEQDSSSANHGGDKKLSVSGDTPSGSGKDDVALVQWDLSASVPTTAVVHAATLTLTISDKADQTYSLYEALRAWDENTATWKRASSAAAWSTSGASGVSDRGTAVLGSIRAASTGTFTITLGAAGVAAVQRWVADPTTNHGVILAGAHNDNRLEFRSREDSASDRPRLEVSWTAGGGSGGPVLDPTPGTYRETCDGSGAVAIDFTHFLNFNDENQTLRIYTRAASASPVQTLDVSAALGMSSDDEADLEDAARVGDRVYAISSHGRNKDGELAATRYRFFALDLAGTVPALQMSFAGSSSTLLLDLLDAANWDHPDLAVIAALQDASQLSRATVADLAPELHGLNIEGLASWPSATTPERLVIGLRNPQAEGRAILVSLLNPADAVAGAPAHFGEVVTLDLGGLGIRGLAWSDAHNAMLVIAGPIADAGPVQLFTWSGDPADVPSFVQALTSPAGTAAEAVVPYPGTHDVQVLFDFGALVTGGTECKKRTLASQSFTDQIIHVE